MPTVSVLIATYNRAAMLREAIESVQAQTFPDWELLVVDDGSTDETPAMLAELSRAEPRLRVIRQDNRGLAAARNVGIRAARGECVAIIDDDDVWLPEKLARQVAFMRVNPELAFSFTLAQLTDPALHPVKIFPARWSSTFQALLERNAVPLPTTMIKRDALLNIGGFDESLSRSTDYDLWLRLARRHPFGCLPQPLCLYRRHGANMSLEPSGRIRAAIRIFEKLRDDRTPGLRPVPQRVLRRRLAGLHYKLGRWHRDRAEFRDGAREFARAVALCPWLGWRLPDRQRSQSPRALLVLKPFLATAYCALKSLGRGPSAGPATTGAAQ